jgi:hypothetical protein
VSASQLVSVMDSWRISASNCPFSCRVIRPHGKLKPPRPARARIEEKNTLFPANLRLVAMPIQHRRKSRRGWVQIQRIYIVHQIEVPPTQRHHLRLRQPGALTKPVDVAANRRYRRDLASLPESQGRPRRPGAEYGPSRRAAAGPPGRSSRVCRRRRQSSSTAPSACAYAGRGSRAGRRPKS